MRVIVAIFVALLAFPAGAQPCEGVAVSPGANLQSLVNANPPGTTFCLAPGTYTGEVVFPKTGNAFIGAGPEQTHIDGNGVAASFLDSITADNVVVRGLDIFNYNPPRRGVIDNRHDAAVGSSGWVIEGNWIHDNHGDGTAINFSSNSVIRHNRIYANGRQSLVGGGNDSLVEGNELFNNNVDNHDMGFSAGTKFVLSNRLVVRGNYVYDNNAPGLWADVNNNDMVYEDNLIVNNRGAGIFHEISGPAIIRNNILVNNGRSQFFWVYGAQIFISSSSGAEIYGNIVEVGPQNGHGIMIADQTRSPGGFDNHVHDNVVTYVASFGQSGVATDTSNQTRRDQVYSTNRFDFNQYQVTSCSAQHWTWRDQARSFSGMRSRGQELNGSCDTNITRIDVAALAPNYGLGYGKQPEPDPEPDPELEELRALVAALEAQVEALTGTMADLEVQIAGLSAELSNAQAYSADLEARISRAVNELTGNQ